MSPSVLQANLPDLVTDRDWPAKHSFGCACYPYVNSAPSRTFLSLPTLHDDRPYIIMLDLVAAICSDHSVSVAGETGARASIIASDTYYPSFDALTYLHEDARDRARNVRARKEANMHVNTEELFVNP